MTISVLAAAVSLMSAAMPVFAHHSFAAGYDSSKPVTMQGTFSKIDWVNPHAWIHVAVAGQDGKVVTWNCEANPPNGLSRSGWTKDTFKPGDEVVVRGFLAKDGSPTLWTITVSTADGQRTLAGHDDLK